MPPKANRLTRQDSLQHQVARNIRNEIDSGTLRHGEVLPSTRELAARWDVSVFTINEAMKLLAADGLIISQARSKRVVHAPGQTSQNEVLLHVPRLILIGGYAGSGKSELGRILSHETGWSMLDKDTLTRPVVEVALEALGKSPHDRESDTYLNMIRPREYEGLIASVNENIASGNSIIAVAPFIREFTDAAWISRTQATYASAGALVTFVWVYCDVGTMHTYLRHRGAARDTAKLADWPGYLASIDIDMRPKVPHIVIDNSASSMPLQDQAKTLLQAIIQQDQATAH
jgi:DNA-binding transcriptional regulator YhcF (GntR family)